MHHSPCRKNHGLFIKRRHNPAARSTVPIPKEDFCVGVCAGRGVCTGSGVVVTGRVVITGGGLSVVVGMTVVMTVCGDVKIPIESGPFLE